MGRVTSGKLDSKFGSRLFAGVTQLDDQASSIVTQTTVVIDAVTIDLNHGGIEGLELGF